jgi:hypothetical protein
LIVRAAAVAGGQAGHHDPFADGRRKTDGKSAETKFICWCSDPCQVPAGTHYPLLRVSHKWLPEAEMEPHHAFSGPAPLASPAWGGRVAIANFHAHPPNPPPPLSSRRLVRSQCHNLEFPLGIFPARSPATNQSRWLPVSTIYEEHAPAAPERPIAGGN